MPRSARASAGGYCYHVINRGNARAEVFHKDEDLEAFVRVMGEAGIRVPMRTEAEVAAIRLSLRRDRPYGTDSWTTETAGCLGLE